MIYIDLDGVLADLDTYVLNEIPEFTREGFLTLCYNKSHEMFLESPVANYAKEFFKEFSHFRILTALPELDEYLKYNHQDDALDKYFQLKHNKLVFCKKYLNIEPENVIIVNTRKEKAYYANANSILFDDYIKNVNDFTNAGGIGVQVEFGDIPKINNHLLNHFENTRNDFHLYECQKIRDAIKN